MGGMGAQLTQAVIEIEQHVAAGGWDQPVRLYALVDTAELVRREPHLEGQMGLASAAPGHLTSVEQEELPEHSTVEELLSGITWPPEVDGAAIVLERVMLPPEVEDELPENEQEAMAWAAEHPQRQEVRLAVAVVRDGTRECAIRFRSQDDDQSVLSGADLVPGLAEALAATLD
jgi:hypothetical protein